MAIVQVRDEMSETRVDVVERKGRVMNWIVKWRRRRVREVVACTTRKKEISKGNQYFDNLLLPKREDYELSLSVSILRGLCDAREKIHITLLELKERY